MCVYCRAYAVLPCKMSGMALTPCQGPAFSRPEIFKDVQEAANLLAPRRLSSDIRDILGEPAETGRVMRTRRLKPRRIGMAAPACPKLLGPFPLRHAKARRLKRRAECDDIPRALKR